MTKPRPTIKLKLNTSSDSRAALGILTAWAALRQTPTHLSQAIRLYEALRTNDARGFFDLLNQYFPGFSLALGLGLAGGTVQPAMSAPGKISFTRDSSADPVDVLNDAAFEADMEF